MTDILRALATAYLATRQVYRAALDGHGSHGLALKESGLVEAESAFIFAATPKAILGLLDSHAAELAGANQHAATCQAVAEEWKRRAEAAEEENARRTIDSALITELPVDLREPLHSLQAGMKHLLGRVAADSSFAGLAAESILGRLSQIEAACYATLSRFDRERVGVRVKPAYTAADARRILNAQASLLNCRQDDSPLGGFDEAIARAASWGAG